MSAWASTRNDPAPSDIEMLDVTTFYAKIYGDLTDRLDRGQLNIPHDRASQWTIFCFIVFNDIKANVCRSSMAKICSMISDHYEFGMIPLHSRIISNIFSKNFVLNPHQELHRSLSKKLLSFLCKCLWLCLIKEILFILCF